MPRTRQHDRGLTLHRELVDLARQRERVEQQQPLAVVDRVRRDLRPPLLATAPLGMPRLPVPNTVRDLAHGAIVGENRRMPAERVPLETHLVALTPKEHELWDRYRELVEAAGPSEMIVTKSRIAFRAAHRTFTGGFFKTRRLELFFDLPTPVPERERDTRFRAVWEHSKTVWVHRLKIERVEELDDKLATWLADACAAYSKPAAER